MVTRQKANEENLIWVLSKQSSEKNSSSGDGANLALEVTIYDLSAEKDGLPAVKELNK